MSPEEVVRAQLNAWATLDAEECQALQAEGLDADDPAVIAAIDLVRWELSLGT